MTDLYNKIRGGFYGQALGDAWAMPAFLNPQQTWDYYGGYIETFLDGPKGHPVHHNQTAGQVTDDTEQAAAIAEVIIEEGGVSEEGVARALVNWYQRIGGDESPYVGPSSRRAIQGIMRGDDLREVGRFGDTNGAAMRISPIGLINPGNLDQAIKDAVVSCIPSHFTDVAVSGAAAIAGAISTALVAGSTLEDVVEAGVQAAREGRGYGNVWLGASIPRRIQWAVDLVSTDKPERERLQDVYDLIGTSLAMSEAVPAAFGVLVMAEGDPTRAAILAATLSGDADTVAAMACAIAGAWKGIDVFHPDHLKILEKANPWLDFEGLISGLYKIAEQRN
jgi:ADP-ribosylglycohydrolase